MIGTKLRGRLRQTVHAWAAGSRYAPPLPPGDCAEQSPKRRRIPGIRGSKLAARSQLPTSVRCGGCGS